MVLLTYCHACTEGDHEHHYEVVQAVPEGMLGGARCRCQGECVEGAMRPVEEITRVCCPMHVCFPPRPSYCLLCRATDPAQCPHPEMLGRTPSRGRSGGS